MSSNIRIQRICEHCGNEFTAKTTVTKFCSHICTSRAYKAKLKDKKIVSSNKQTLAVINRPIEEVKAKDFLTAKEVAMLLNCSVRTVYRLIDNGTIKATNLADRMTRIKRSNLDQLIN